MGRGRGLEGGVVGDSYDINTQMEGDTIYNTGEEGMEVWSPGSCVAQYQRANFGAGVNKSRAHLSLSLVPSYRVLGEQ